MGPAMDWMCASQIHMLQASLQCDGIESGVFGK